MTFCVFRTDRKAKMTAPASGWLRYFRLLLCNHWTEFDETWQEARTQCPLSSLCFFEPIGKPRWPSRPLIDRLRHVWHISWNSTKITTSSTKPVFWVDQKPKMVALTSDWLNILIFSSGTTGQNFTKLDKKQETNRRVLYQVLYSTGQRPCSRAYSILSSGRLSVRTQNFVPRSISSVSLKTTKTHLWRHVIGPIG